MAEYEPIKGSPSLATSTAESSESRVLSDEELVDVEEDFASFKCYTPKEMESLSVTFTQSQLSYNLENDIVAHFYAPTSLYQMKPDDVVGICPMRKSLPFISKTVSECEVESNPQANSDEIFDEASIVAKKAIFKIPTLPVEMASEFYFQFCYLNSKHDVIGVSTPFRFQSNGSTVHGACAAASTMEMSQMISHQLESIGENYDSMVMEKRDDDDFIVVRSQESFLKERVEHLTKSNGLLEYLIRSMEKDLSNKKVELQKICNLLENEKANANNSEEEKNKALAKLEIMSRQDDERQKMMAELEQLIEKERSGKELFQSELEFAKKKIFSLEDNFKGIQIGEVELKNILKDKEEEISLYKDMVENLKLISENANKRLVAAENKELTLQSSLAKALNDCRALQQYAEKVNNYDLLLSENVALKQRVSELELVKEKHASEIKTLEDELRNSVSNFNSLDAKFQAEREANATKEQKNALDLDKTRCDLIEMHARLEQARVEYANLYRKYRSFQKADRSKLDKASPIPASRSHSIASIASTSTAGRSSVIALEGTNAKIDDIDLKLQQLEKELDTQKQPAPILVAADTAKPSAPPLLSSNQSESLLIDIESEHSHDTASTASNISEQVEAHTSAKTLEAAASSSATPPTKDKSLVPIPCIMCDQVIECRQHEDGSGQMYEMVNHLEVVHKQKMCPVCSTLFDTRLPIFSTYFANHIQNHFNNIKYPNLNQN